MRIYQVALEDHDLHWLFADVIMVLPSSKAGTGVGNPKSTGEQSPRQSVAFFFDAFVRIHGLRVSSFHGLVSWGGALLQRSLSGVFPTPTTRPPFMRRKHDADGLNQTHDRNGTNAPIQFKIPSPMFWRVGLSANLEATP